MPKTSFYLHQALAASITALAVAGCQTAPPTQATFVLGEPTLSSGTFQDASQAKAVTPQTDGSGGTYFTLSLPEESKLLKQITKVTGTPGSMTTLLASATSPVVTNVIPNKTGLIVEGQLLNKAGLRFVLGGTDLGVTKRESSSVQLTIPKNLPTSGIFIVKDGATEVIRTSVDANSVYVLGRVMVKFVEGAPRASVEKALQTAGMLYYRYPGMNYVVAYYPMTLSFDQARAKLMAQTVFQDCTRDTLYLGKDLTVNDPQFSKQWALPMIHAPRGWQFSTGSPDAIVAVLDSGVDLTHPDIAPNLFKNTFETAGNGKDDDNNGRIDDYNGWNSYSQNGNVADDNGHGTNVAGIIGAMANNNLGIAGLAFNSRIMPVKVMNAQGQATTSSIVDGINYAVRNRASVINMSIASLIDDAPLKAAVEFAISFNVTVVASMGNDGARIKEYPAAWSRETGLIAVGPTNTSDVRPVWGTTGEWMTVSAPGENILTTSVGGGYATVSGSSLSAAYAAGMAAMIKASKPTYTPAMIREIMTSTAVDRGATGYDQEYGYGRINFDDTLQSAIGSVDLIASSEHFEGIYPADRAGDKDSETYWSSARRQQDNPEWLKLDAGRVVSVTSVALLSAPYYSFLFPADFTIETSVDGITWKAVAAETDFQIDESTWHRWNIPPTQARFVRLNISRSRQNPDNDLYYDQVAEIALNGEENAIIRNSSSNYYGIFYNTHYMTDKDPNTYWVSANRKDMKPEFAIADLGVTKSIKSFDLLSPPRIISEAFPKSIAFYVSNDKVNWTFVQEFKNLKATPSSWYHFPVNTTSGRYIRLDITETNNAKSNGSLYAGHQLEGYTAAVAEVEVNRP
ncbi:MAG: in-like serine protease [Cyanobacteria bacterium RYN_339]|nr:in-like serine protease [Cyanobacteria bacterium RYN_339]